MTGIVVIAVGMGRYPAHRNTSYTFIIGALFVMGLGVGGTMMPIMTSAFAALTDQKVARGSTLMNIVQQVAASIGTALFSVLLTNGIKDIDVAPSAPEFLTELGEAYAAVFMVATILVAACLIPAFMLPRKKARHRSTRRPGRPLTPPPTHRAPPEAAGGAAPFSQL